MTNYYLVKLMQHLSEHKKLLLFSAIFWTLTIAFFCLISSNDLPKMQLNIDKIGHFGFHFGFTILWFLYFYISSNQQNRNQNLIITILLSIGYSVLIEICQSAFTKTRTADPLDVIANTVGMLFAVFLIFKYIPTKKITK